VETILDCAHAYLLKGHSSFRSHKAPFCIVINTSYTNDQLYESECPVQPASPNISPKVIL